MNRAHSRNGKLVSARTPLEVFRKHNLTTSTAASTGRLNTVARCGKLTLSQLNFCRDARKKQPLTCKGGCRSRRSLAGPTSTNGHSPSKPRPAVTLPRPEKNRAAMRTNNIGLRNYTTLRFSVSAASFLSTESVPFNRASAVGHSRRNTTLKSGRTFACGPSALIICTRPEGSAN